MTVLPTSPEVSGVTPEAAAPIDSNPVQPIAQTTEQAAQPTVEGQGTIEDQQAIPYERFKEVNDSNKALQQQLQFAQTQNQIYQANTPQVQQQIQPQSRLEQIATKLEQVTDDGEGSINLNEAKELVSAVQDEMSNMRSAQAANQNNTFLAQNPDFSTLVGQDGALGMQYTPDFQQMISENPQIHQQLVQLGANPVAQYQTALNYARQYQQSKAPVPGQAPVQAVQALPGQVPMNVAPPSLSAIPTPMGQNQAATNYSSMSRDDFLAHADSIRQG